MRWMNRWRWYRLWRMRLYCNRDYHNTLPRWLTRFIGCQCPGRTL